MLKSGCIIVLLIAVLVSNSFSLRNRVTWPHPRDPWGLAKENTKRWNDYPGYNYWDDWLVKVGDSNREKWPHPRDPWGLAKEN